MPRKRGRPKNTNQKRPHLRKRRRKRRKRTMKRRIMNPRSLLNLYSRKARRVNRRSTNSLRNLLGLGR
jgi:hypothetical protein